VLILGATVSAQSPTYHLGRAPTPDEVRAWDISISPTGTELPPGHGTAKEGKDLFIEKGCVQCHGRNGEGGKAPTLIVMKGMSTAPGRPMPGMDMGIQGPGLMAVSAPFATTMRLPLPAAATARIFVAAGNPAPPRPSSPLRSISAMSS
jgi:cytochrome c